MTEPRQKSPRRRGCVFALVVTLSSAIGLAVPLDARPRQRDGAAEREVVGVRGVVAAGDAGSADDETEGQSADRRELQIADHVTTLLSETQMPGC